MVILRIVPYFSLMTVHISIWFECNISIFFFAILRHFAGRQIYLIHIHSKKQMKNHNKVSYVCSIGKKNMSMMRVNFQTNQHGFKKNKINKKNVNTHRKKSVSWTRLSILTTQRRKIASNDKFRLVLDKFRLESVWDYRPKWFKISLWNVTCTGWMKVRNCRSMVAGPLLHGKALSSLGLSLPLRGRVP